MGKRISQALSVALATFLISLLLSVISNTAIGYLPLALSVLLLVVIILMGIAADIVGVAVTAADESSLHAMAAHRVHGAIQAVWLVRHADRVANIANDVIGDIAGTLSGAIAASIVFAVVRLGFPVSETVLSTLVVAMSAALTVGGKAYGKGFSIRRADDIVFLVGRVMFQIERLTGLTIWQNGKNKRKERGSEKSSARRKALS